jgi:hypothetical protein
MQKLMSIILVLVMFVFCGCTTLRTPQRFTVSDNGKIYYCIDGEDDKGFDLEVYYNEYSFFPNPESAIQNSKSLFIEQASYIAEQKNKEIHPIKRTRISTSVSRDIISAFYTVFASGRVDYK